MLKTLVKGLIGGILSLIVVSIVVFALVRVSGNPVTLLAPPDATKVQIHAISASFGLDHSLLVQYWDFASSMVQGNFGTSIEYGIPVANLYVQALPETLELAGIAFALALFWGLVVGLYAAHKPNGVFDYAARLFCALGQSIPPFVVGLLLILLLAVSHHVFPAAGDVGWKAAVLPVFTLAWTASAPLMRLTRSAALEVLGADFITLARLKGLSETAVLWRHTLKNAALPVLTFATLVFINMLSGTIVIETVFSWPGIGLLMVNGIQARDYPVVQAGVVMFAALYVVANMLVDMLYVVLNPALRKTGDA